MQERRNTSRGSRLNALKLRERVARQTPFNIPRPQPAELRAAWRARLRELQAELAAHADHCDRCARSIEPNPFASGACPAGRPLLRALRAARRGAEWR